MNVFIYSFLFLLSGSLFSQVTTITRKQIEALPSIGTKFSSIQKDTFEYFYVPDTNISKYTLSNEFRKPKKWQDSDSERAKGINWYSNKYPEFYTLEKALIDLRQARWFSSVMSIKSWCIENYRIAFPYLIAMLSDKKKVGLTNTADLIIWDRMGTGDLQFYGHGGCVNEDLFTVAGRASWILNEITGEHFAVVHGNLSKQQAEEFKKMWVDYIRNNSN